MDQKINYAEWLVQLARLGLAGRRQDLLTYVRRVVRLLRETDAATADQLAELLRDAPTTASPLRGSAVATVPVDVDSRLNLVRQEWPVVLEFDPIWAQQVRQPLDQVLAERQRMDELRRAGITPTRSLLFTGAPGVGKTLAARWLALGLGWPLLTLDLSAVMSSFLGRTGNNVRHVLDYAKGTQCVLLLDELDAIAKRRDDAGEVGELKRLVTVLLQEIDDWPPAGLLIAATNHPDLLDPAVWRRFDSVVEFPLPDDTTVKRLVQAQLGQDGAVAPEVVEALAILFRQQSPALITRELTRARREALVSDASLTSVLKQVVHAHCKELGRKERREVALALSKCGISQRRVEQLMGMGRDTVRSAQRLAGAKQSV